MPDLMMINQLEVAKSYVFLTKIFINIDILGEIILIQTTHFISLIIN